MEEERKPHLLINVHQPHENEASRITEEMNDHESHIVGAIQ
jgi:hypothetical protein